MLAESLGGGHTTGSFLREGLTSLRKVGVRGVVDGSPVADSGVLGTAASCCSRRRLLCNASSFHCGVSTEKTKRKVK